MKKGTLADKLLSLIYPTDCPYCGKIIDYYQVKCDKCAEKIEYSLKTVEIVPKIECISPFLYSGAVRDAVWKFKFDGYGNYAWNFSVEISKAIKSVFGTEKFSGVTYVPLSRSRKKERGYDQAELLARNIGENFNIPVIKILEKIKDNTPQHLIKTAEDREKNVKGVYRAVAKCGRQRNKLILCDDVITSGNTLKECVKVLKNAGFVDILCVTIANAMKI